MGMEWFSKLLMALMITTINLDYTHGKLLVHHRKLNSNDSKRHYVITEEEIQDTYFVPQQSVQPLPLVPQYPVINVVQQPVAAPATHKHEHKHGHEQGQDPNHAYLPEQKKEQGPKHEHEHEDEHEHEHEQEHEDEQQKENTSQNNHEDKTSYSLDQFSKAYRRIGCYKDAEPRAVASLEGSDAVFREFYKTRIDAVEKCAKVAKARGYQIFTVQNGGFCSSAPNAHHTFQIYGPAKNCRNGRGGEWASDVYIFNDYSYEVTVQTGNEQKSSTDAKVSVTLYGSLGSSRNIVLKPQESTNDPFQSGQIDKFMVSTVPLGDLTRLHVCHDNTGSFPAWYLESIAIKDPTNKIFIFPCNCWLKDDKEELNIQRNLFPAIVINPGSYKYMGCYNNRKKTKASDAMARHGILDSHPSSAISKREYVIEKCAHQAQQGGYLFFEIQNSNECLVGSNAQDTYTEYGLAVDCHKDSTGGPSSVAVYAFNDQEPKSRSTTDTK